MSSSRSTLEIPGLPPETLKALDEKARRLGKTPADYVRTLIESDLSKGPSFDEILAPFRQEVEASGITDDELDTLFTEARRNASRVKSEKPPE